MFWTTTRRQQIPALHLQCGTSLAHCSLWIMLLSLTNGYVEVLIYHSLYTKILPKASLALVGTWGHCFFNHLTLPCFEIKTCPVFPNHLNWYCHHQLIQPYRHSSRLCVGWQWNVVFKCFKYALDARLSVVLARCHDALYNISMLSYAILATVCFATFFKCSGRICTNVLSTCSAPKLWLLF